MKKRVMGLTMTLSFLLAGCNYQAIEMTTATSSETTSVETSITEESFETESVETTIDELSGIDDKYAWQIKVIMDNSSIWERSEDHPFMETNESDRTWLFTYCITDLDHDGYLELMKNAEFTNGPVTTLWLFEVTEDGELVELSSDLEDDKNVEFRSTEYPDLPYSEPLRFYVDEDGVYRYLGIDVHSWGIYGADNYYGIWSVSDNNISYELLFMHSTEADEDSTEYINTYFDSDDNEIDEDEYNRLHKEYEALFTDEIQLGWFSEVTTENLVDSFNTYIGG